MTEGLFYEPEETGDREDPGASGEAIADYADPGHTQPSEVRYVSSGDSAASGDTTA